MNDLNIARERKLFCDALRSQNVNWSETTDDKIMRCFGAAFSGWMIAQRAAIGRAQPVSWVRFRSDGGIEGPIMDDSSAMCDIRRRSGAWTPLYTAPPTPAISGSVKQVHEAIEAAITRAEQCGSVDVDAVDLYRWRNALAAPVPGASAGEVQDAD